MAELVERHESGAAAPGELVDPEPYFLRARAVLAAFESWDWQAPARAEAELDAILQSARDFLESDDPRNAARVAHAVLEEVMLNYCSLQDEAVTFPGFIARGSQLLVTCLSRLEADPEARQPILRALLDLHWFAAGCATDEDVERLRGVLAGQTTPAERAELAVALRAKISEVPIDYLDPAVDELLFDLEADTLDEETYLGQLRERGRCIELVRELLRRECVDEALEVAVGQPDEALPTLAGLFASAGCPEVLEPRIRERETRSHSPGFLRWLVDHTAEAEPGRALDVAERLYRISSPNMSYAAVRELALRCDRWSELYPQFIEWIESQKQWPQLSEAFLLEGEIDRALSLLTDPRSMYLDPVRIARAAEEIRPQAAIDIYQKRIQEFIDARGRGNYAAAVSLLLRVRDLFEQMEDLSGWERYLAGLREQNKGLPSLEDELAHAGL